MKTIDFIFTDSGTIVWLTPMTRKANKWVNKNLCIEAFQDDNNIPIEPRYFNDISEAIKQAGMLIQNF